MTAADIALAVFFAIVVWWVWRPRRPRVDHVSQEWRDEYRRSRDE